MELHVWGYDGEIALISPESIAVVWYASLLKIQNLTIITSSNINYSNHELPTLIPNDENNTKIDGFSNIVKFFQTQGYDLNSELTTKKSILNDGLISYSLTNFNILFQYTLFLNKDNYEQYSRSIFGQYLSFPLQYNTPLQYRSLAKRVCSQIGLTVEDKSQIEQEIIKNVPTISSVQKRQNESLIEDRLNIKNSVTNMRCLNYLETVIETIEKLRSELGNNEFIISDKISSSDVLILSYLYVLTNDKLPDQFITTYLNNRYPDLLKSVQTQGEEFITRLQDLSIRNPNFNESANLFNSVKSLFI